MIPENIVTNAIKKDFKELLKDLYYEVKENKVSTNSFQFEWQYNTEYLQVLVVHGRFCQLQTNSPVMASLCILQTKNTFHVPYLP